MNKAAWQRLPPDIQKIFKEEAERVVEARAFTAIEEWNQEGMTKSVEKGMEHLPFSPEIRATIKEIVRNEIIAPLVGFKVDS